MTRPERYELGILFVHGIGEQLRGQTLTSMGEPFAEWLRRWLAGAVPPSNRSQSPEHVADYGTSDISEVTSRDSPVEVADARIIRGEGDAPASVCLSITSETLEKSGHWLLAESRWADVFLPASFGQLGRWGLIVGPVVLASQISSMVQRLLGTVEAASEAATRWLSRFQNLPGSLRSILIAGAWLLGAVLGFIAMVTLFIMAAIGAFLFEVLAVALLVLAFLPIPWLRDPILSLQRGLANGLGDSYVLVQSPFQYTAMVGRVQRDAKWLADQCDHVVVIAHSQGAAVTYDAMRSPPDRPEQVSLLITFGQGLRKLRSLAALHRTSLLTWAGRGFWALFGISSLCLMLLGLSAIVVGCQAVRCDGLPLPADISIFEAVRAELGSRWGLIGLAAVGAVFVSQLLIFSLAQSGDKRLESALEGELKKMGLAPGTFEWLDLYASADPVPNGPLVTAGAEPPGFQTRQVRNLGSTIVDHSRYWQNPMEFVTMVVVRTALVAGWRLDSAWDGDEARIKAAYAMRNQRVSVLTGFRLIALVTVVALVASIGRQLPEVGHAILGPLPDTLPIVGSISDLPRIAVGFVAAAVIAAAGYVWYTLAHALWAWATASDERRFFTRANSARYWTSTPHFLTVLLLATAVGGGAAAVVGVTGKLGFALLYLLLLGGAWLLVTVYPAIASRSSAVAPYLGPEVAMADPMSGDAQDSS